jgi:hypothetical protein
MAAHGSALGTGRDRKKKLCSCESAFVANKKLCGVYEILSRKAKERLRE